MKNLFVVSMIMFAFSATSCKKDYTCTCTIYSTETIVTEKQKKKDAEEECDKMDADAKTIDSNGGCELSS